MLSNSWLDPALVQFRCYIFTAYSPETALSTSTSEKFLIQWCVYVPVDHSLSDKKNMHCVSLLWRFYPGKPLSGRWVFRLHYWEKFIWASNGCTTQSIRHGTNFCDVTKWENAVLVNIFANYSWLNRANLADSLIDARETALINYALIFDMRKLLFYYSDIYL